VAYHGKRRDVGARQENYVADTIEPNRDFDGVDDLRELAYRDLDKAVLACIGTVIGELVSEGRQVFPVTIEAAEALRKKEEKNQGITE
jgi:nicotinate-nucleotide adenylyltransferase